LRGLAVVGLFISCACSAWAQTASQDPCDALPKVVVPEADRPTLADVQAAGVRWNPVVKPDAPYFPEPSPADRSCDASQSYYFSKAPDRFEHARACVLAKLGLFRHGTPAAQAKLAQYAAAGGATDPADIYEPEGLILAMMYANGEGVPRNLPLAKQFVCEYGGGIQGEEPAKLMLQLQDIVKSGKHYDVCAGDFGDFGLTTDYFCLGIQIEDVKRGIARERAAIAAAASPQLKASFVALETAHRRFAAAFERWESDSCGGGTGCGVSGEAVDLAVEKSWSKALKDVEAGKAPAGGVAASSPADRNRQPVDQGDTGDDESTAKSATACQTALQNYREAWVRFGALRWPEISAGQWRTWADAQYLELLKESD